MPDVDGHGCGNRTAALMFPSVQKGRHVPDHQVDDCCISHYSLLYVLIKVKYTVKKETVDYSLLYSNIHTLMSIRLPQAGH